MGVIYGLPDLSTFNQLELQVLQAGKCLKCHTKSLRDLTTIYLDARQCTQCLTVFVLGTNEKEWKSIPGIGPTIANKVWRSLHEHN